MAKKEKRRTLFTKYEFEIGVVTLPFYFSILLIGLVFFAVPVGQAFTILGLIGTGAAGASMAKGYKEIVW